MSRFPVDSSLCAVLLLAAIPCLAQAQTVNSANPGANQTTAIVGVTASQTARLNVLNLQPVIPGVTAILCPATLEFYDDSGAQLKQLVVTNISPATAASLVFKPTVPSTSTTARAQIRGVVFTPASVTTTTGGPGTVSFFPISLGCNLMTSLEIIDDATGATHFLTTDLRSMPSFTAMPLQLVH
jgi:hypothetical protein